MKSGGALLVAAVAGLAAGYSGAAYLRAGDGGGELLRSREPTLAETTRRLEVEYPLAESRKPYLVLDLSASRLDYRISGVTTKSIPLRVDSIRTPRGRADIGSGRLKLLTLHDRGAPPEVIRPPDPSAPVDPLKDPKIFPPDPPTDYTLSFDQPVRIRIQGEGSGGVADALRGAGKTIRERLGAGGGGSHELAMLRVRVSAGRAQEIYRALFQGEKVLVLGFGEKAPKAGPMFNGR